MRALAALPMASMVPENTPTSPRFQRLVLLAVPDLDLRRFSDTDDAAYLLPVAPSDDGALLGSVICYGYQAILFRGQAVVPLQCPDRRLFVG